MEKILLSEHHANFHCVSLTEKVFLVKWFKFNEKA